MLCWKLWRIFERLKRTTEWLYGDGKTVPPVVVSCGTLYQSRSI